MSISLCPLCEIHSGIGRQSDAGTGEAALTRLLVSSLLRQQRLLSGLVSSNSLLENARTLTTNDYCNLQCRFTRISSLRARFSCTRARRYKGVIGIRRTVYVLELEARGLQCFRVVGNVLAAGHRIPLAPRISTRGIFRWKRAQRSLYNLSHSTL